MNQCNVRCRDFVEVIDDYLSGEAPLTARRTIDVHLTACGECAAYLKTYQATITLIQRSAEPQMSILESQIRAIITALRS